MFGAFQFCPYDWSMTIQMQHLSIVHDARATALDATGTDVTLDRTYRVDLLSVVRQVMRERDCRIIPVVRAAVRFPSVNQWGHNGEVEVTYDDRGYRAIYGVHFGQDGVTKVQCYMD